MLPQDKPLTTWPALEFLVLLKAGAPSCCWLLQVSTNNALMMRADMQKRALEAMMEVRLWLMQPMQRL